MKSILCCLLTALLLSSGYVFAQKGNYAAPLPNDLATAPPPDQRPDLIVTSFNKGSVITSPTIINGVPHKKYTVSYTAVVKNIGKNATTRSCDIGDPFEGRTGYGTIPILASGQSATVQGSISGTVAANISAISVSVMADIPNGSYEDNPDPTYGDIRESNEQNNRTTNYTIGF